MSEDTLNYSREMRIAVCEADCIVAVILAVHSVTGKHGCVQKFNLAAAVLTRQNLFIGLQVGTLLDCKGKMCGTSAAAE